MMPRCIFYPLPYVLVVVTINLLQNPIMHQSHIPLCTKLARCIVRCIVGFVRWVWVEDSWRQTVSLGHCKLNLKACSINQTMGFVDNNVIMKWMPSPKQLHFNPIPHIWQPHSGMDSGRQERLLSRLIGWQPSMPPLRWRHNGRDSVSNHQPHDCLLNFLSLKALRHWPLCGEFTGKFPAQMASNAKNVSIWWRHHNDEAITPTVPQSNEWS